MAERKEVNSVMKKRLGFFLFTAAMVMAASPVFAETAEAVQSGGGNAKVWFFISVAIASAFGMAIAAVGAGNAQSNAIRGAVEGIARNPGASGKILTTMLVGIAMIESLAIYALVIALILLFANPFLKYLG